MIFHKPPRQVKAIALALLVVILWSTSWVLIKIGLKKIPILEFVAFRYSLAFFFLLPLLFRKQQRECIHKLNFRNWVEIGILGFASVAITQAAQFVGLALLPSVTVSLILNLSPLFVTIIAVWLLKESPSGRQWIGVALNLLGISIYFLPIALNHDQFLGIAIVVAGLGANAISSLLGRKINREKFADPITITGLSMGIGSFFLIVSSLVIQRWSAIDLAGWLIIIFLALVNTAFAFILWNYTMQTLKAMESSILNGFMLIFIAIFAWIFIGESLSFKSILGMVVALIGGILVQLPRKKVFDPQIRSEMR
jgi:drug/metabolite transporter (DMT)-like permease